MPAHANSYLARRVLIGANVEHGSAPGSRCSSDTAGSSPALAALSARFQRVAIPASRTGRLLMGFLFTGRKERPCLSTQAKQKARFPPVPKESCPGNPWTEVQQLPESSLQMGWLQVLACTLPDGTPKAAVPLHT